MRRYGVLVDGSWFSGITEGEHRPLNGAGAVSNRIAGWVPSMSEAQAGRMFWMHTGRLKTVSLIARDPAYNILPVRLF